MSGASHEIGRECNLLTIRKAGTKSYQKGIKFLIQAQRKEDLYPFKSLNFEALHGNKEGRFSIRANDQYRI
ncbi:MAG: type II toxin-antitoxin system RelE/ParE family toxin, partial [Prevotella sp.]|nr:type II toxin-antitoxin system RelE/ParE family toxin [Prevotella sp.]MBR4368052.1 type II toxin-antitoxin system RelE/ParE family toxin [Prevotella sp.]